MSTTNPSTLASTILTIDSIVAFISGLTLFFAPDKVSNFVFNKQTDGVHWHLVRCIGGQLTASSYFLWRFRNRPIETNTTCFILRLSSCIFILLLAFNSRSEFPGLVQPYLLQCLIYFCFFVIIIYGLLLTKSKWIIGSTLYDNHPGGNGLYQLDSLASIMIGMAWIACPKWLLHRQVKIILDSSHELCGRIMGTFFVSGYVVSSHSLHWKYQKDRNLAAESRSLCCLLILSAQIWSQIAYEDDWSDKHWVGISLFSTWTVIAFIYRCYIFFFIKEKQQ